MPSSYIPPGGGSISVTDGSTTVSPASSVDFTSGATVSDLGSGVAGVVVSGGSSNATNLGMVSGTVNIVTSNGPRQYCWISGDTELDLTSFPPDVAEMDDLDLCVQFANGNYNITFANWVSSPSWINWSFPITTTPWRQITFKLSFRGGAWCLMDVIGDFPESVD